MSRIRKLLRRQRRNNLVFLRNISDEGGIDMAMMNMNMNNMYVLNLAVDTPVIA